MVSKVVVDVLIGDLDSEFLFYNKQTGAGGLDNET